MTMARRQLGDEYERLEAGGRSMSIDELGDLIEAGP